MACRVRTLGDIIHAGTRAYAYTTHAFTANTRALFQLTIIDASALEREGASPSRDTSIWTLCMYVCLRLQLLLGLREARWMRERKENTKDDYDDNDDDERKLSRTLYTTSIT